MLKELTYKEIEQAYNDFILPYFPRDEVKPLRIIQKMVQENNYRVLAIMEEEHPEKIAGCAFIALHPGCRACLLDYYAIREDLRCKNYGSSMLQQLSDRTIIPYPIMIETELAEAAENEEERALRIRRDSFYERNKVGKTHLVTLIYGVWYSIWLIGKEEGFSVAQEMEKVYRYMIPKELYEENCQIPAEFPLQKKTPLV